MTLLTVDELREHVKTSLVDDALERLLDDAEAAIVRYAGDLADVTEYVDGGGPKLVLKRRAAAITSIVESHGSSPLTLAVDDWRQLGAYVLERLNTGTNRRSTFRGPVQVVYELEDDTATRKIVQLDLVKLEIANNPGLAAETVGSWTQQYLTNSSRTLPDSRGDVLSRLREPGVW